MRNKSSASNAQPSTSSAPRMAREFRFERIEAWQLARVLNKTIYAVTREFPKEEQFGLTSQLRRASVSVSSNTAEGSGRNSDVDFAHFLEIAYGSLMEPETRGVGVACRRQPRGRDSREAGRQFVSQLILALDENYLTKDSFDQLANDADLLAGKIAALSKSLGRVSRIAPPPTLATRSSASSSQPSTLVNRHSTV